MSNYRAAAYHPDEGVVRVAEHLDDYFAQHLYGVRFDKGGKVYRPQETVIPTDMVFVPRHWLNVPPEKTKAGETE